MENFVSDNLLRWKLIQLSNLTYEWLGESLSLFSLFVGRETRTYSGGDQWGHPRDGFSNRQEIHEL